MQSCMEGMRVDYATFSCPRCFIHFHSRDAEFLSSWWQRRRFLQCFCNEFIASLISGIVEECSQCNFFVSLSTPAIEKWLLETRHVKKKQGCHNLHYNSNEAA